MDKLSRLKSIIKDMGSVLVAFSGGLDSTFLLKVAHDTLVDKACALTATSPAYSKRELKEAMDFCAKNSIKHIIVESDEINLPAFKNNERDRCYHCKRELFSLCIEKAKELGIKHVADGHNEDDLSDYRPGSRAADELSIRRPLLEAGFSKLDIRNYSKELGLSSWDKASYACLASRFPYGTEISEDRLKNVGILEDFIRDRGFKQVRVRFHNEVARIEVCADDIPRFLGDEDLREKIVDKARECGFIYTAVDLEGYRTGSMNES